MIGERLKLARAKEGLSLRGLAAKMDHLVTAQAIGRYERDECMPSSTVFFNLAEALEVPAGFLLGFDTVTVHSIEYRKNIWNGKKGVAKTDARIADWIKKCLIVEYFLGINSHEWDRWVGLRRTVEQFSEVEYAANDLRDLWNLGESPIAHLDEVLESRGIKILRTELPKEGGLLSKVIVDESSWIPLVLMNVAEPGERQRLALAHELGHLLLEPKAKLPLEKMARRFGHAFLVPANTLKQYVGKKRDDIGWDELFDLKRIFAVPVYALICRCAELGIFRKPLSQRLLNECEKYGWKSGLTDEPQLLPSMQVGRFERMCSRAYAEDTCSASRAAELLNIPSIELMRRMDAPPQETYSR